MIMVADHAVPPAGLSDSVATARAWADAITDFRAELRALGRAPGTIRLRLYWVLRFAADHRAHDPWRDVSREALVAWLAAGTWDLETRRSILSGLRQLYSWGHDTGLQHCCLHHGHTPRCAGPAAQHDGHGRTCANPTWRLPAITQPPPNPDPAPDEVIAEALSGAELRDALMLMLAAFLGMRREEVARVHRRNLFRRLGGGSTCWYLRVRGKGNKVREIPVPDGLAELIVAQGTGYLFPSRARGHMHLTPGYVGKRISAALPGRWTAHKLRHAAATAWADAGLDLDELATLLGHASTNTTRIYVLRRSARAEAAVTDAAARLIT